MQNRSIGVMIILTLFTCGLYQIYWYIVFHMEVKEKTGEGLDVFMHIIATLFTCGIYSIYWAFITGKRLVQAGAKEDYSIIYLLLVIFSFGFINQFIMQYQANEITTKRPY